MEFRRCTEAEMYQALKAANENYEYADNLRFFDHVKRNRGALFARLCAKHKGVEGTRLSRRFTPTRHASWEAHRDFLRELFKINQNASVRTRFAHYNGAEKFEELFSATAYVNVGSVMEPVTLPELTCEPEPPKPPIPRAARKPFNALVRKVRAAFATRVLVGEFDDVRHSALDERATYNLLGKLAVLAELNDYIPREAAVALFAPRDSAQDKWRPAKDRFASNINAAKRYWEQHIYEEQA